MTTPYRTAPRPEGAQRIVLKRTRTWPLLLCVPLIISLRTHVVTIFNDDDDTRNVFVDHGWLVLVAARGYSSGYVDGAAFTGEHIEPYRPRSTQYSDMMPIRAFLGFVALAGVAAYVFGRREKGTEVIVDRRSRVVRVMTPGKSREVPFGDRPLLVIRGDDILLHAGKAEPILLARANQCPSSQVEHLRRAMATLD